MAIESISAGRPDFTAASSVSTATSSQRQSKEASARITEPVEFEKASVSRDITPITENEEEKSAQSQKPVDNGTLKRKISDINRQLNATECQFGIHEETQRVTLKIVDKETKEVLKEFPAEKTLEMIAKVWEMAGLLVDEKR